MNAKLKTVLIVTGVVGIGVALIMLNDKIESISATQDNILLTLQDSGIIENLNLGTK